MSVFKRSWLGDDSEIQNRLWVDEKQKEIAEILPSEESIGRIFIRCHIYGVPGIAIFAACLVMGRSGFLFSFDMVLRYWIFLFALVAILGPLEAFIFRKSWGYIEIYSKMMAVYEYDEERKKLYLSSCYYWKDITRYDSGIDGIRIDFISGEYICFKARRKEFYPYLMAYAPQAKKLTREERRAQLKAKRQEQKQWVAERKKEEAEYKRQIKGYNEKKKALIEGARQKAREEQNKSKDNE